MGIPVGMISAIYDLALTTGQPGSSRRLRIEHVCGDQPRPEKATLTACVSYTALEAVQTAVPGPTLFDPMDMAREREVSHAS